MKDTIHSALILETIEATTKDEALDEIVSRAADAGRFTKPRAKKIRTALAEREARGSTGIGNGVAVPHIKLNGSKETVMVLARSVPGIAYDAVDGKLVHTVFLLVAPVDTPEDHLQLLRWISGLARNVDFRRFVQSAGGEEDIRAMLNEMTKDL